MASNLVSIALRSARNGLQTSLKTNGQVAVRTMSTPVSGAQDKFQTADDTPVYRKGGPMDLIMYRFTMGLCAGSVSLIFYNIFLMANKK